MLDLGSGEGPVFGNGETALGQEGLPDVAFAGHDREGRIHEFVTFLRFEFFDTDAHLGENRVLLVGRLGPELRVALAAERFAESPVGGGIVEEEKGGGCGDVERARRVVEADGRFEVFAGIVVEDEGDAATGVLRASKMVDEGSGKGDLLAVPRELLVHEAFEIGLGNEGVFGSDRREESVFHLIEMYVSGRIAVLEDAAVVADELFGEELEEG